MNLFSIEGVEATGKSSVLLETIELLSKNKVLCAPKTEFPTDPELINPIMSAIEKSIFISESFSSGPASAFFFMLAADCAPLPVDLDKDTVVISERGIDSVAIYQKFFLPHARNEETLPFLHELENIYRMIGQTIPQTTFILQASQETIFKRFCEREGRELSQHEKKIIIGFIKEYKRLAEFGGRYVAIDAEKSITEIAHVISQHILKEMI